MGSLGPPTRERIEFTDEIQLAIESTPFRSRSMEAAPVKRDMELVHKLLFFVEERGSRLFKGNISIEGYERTAIVEHLYLLVNGGFVELGQDTLADKGPLCLTWKGCDYMDQLRRQHQPKKA